MEVSVKHVYTSAACNRIPEICDWNSQGLICFGASNAVVVYDTNIKGSDPLTVHSHHRSKVNSVKWLRKPDGSSKEFLSCSADNTAALWSLIDGKWAVTGSMTGHTDGITCIHGIYTSEDDLVVYTGSIDCTVRVWERKNGSLAHIQTINLNSGLCLTLHSHLLPVVHQPVLFCALDDHKIHIFAGEEYHRVHTLVGHEDWVRGMDVLNVDKSTVLLASASQDTYIRLWRILLHDGNDSDPGIKVEQKLFNAYGKQWAVKLEAVLAGHEGWVYGVQWHPGVFDEGNFRVPKDLSVLCSFEEILDSKTLLPVYRLLSSSLDKTLIIWEPDGSREGKGEGDSGGVWVEKVRVGEVGGNGLGFYGSRFGPRGDSFLGHGYNGSFHIWNLDQETQQWEPAVVCGGHFNVVEDVRWEPEGRYILSVSADQTTRLHAPWKRPDGRGAEWHEISRPQVHGYDMSSVAPVSASVFAAAAEEKLVRVFRAPANQLRNFTNITGLSLGDGDSGGPEGASVPSLGLSNKAVFSADDSQSDIEDDNDGYFVPVELKAPPTEETLMQNTLWPEIHKLYGHGYEVYCLDASPDGSLLASACKATVQEHAAVLLWETTNWQQIQKLISHTLTVTQLAFSPCSQELLSVSRDRKWTLWNRREGTNTFDLAACTDKTNGVHSRIIWCCAWAHDGRMFGTGSRDGKICLWAKQSTTTETSLKDYGLFGKPLEADSSVTALAFLPVDMEHSALIGAGFETGVIRIYRFGWTLMLELDNSAAHHLTVKRLSFKRKPEERTEDSQVMMMASCSADNFVRIYRISLCLWSKAEAPSQTSLKEYGLFGKPLDTKYSVNALAFAPLNLEHSRLIAAGFENGLVRMYRFGVDGWQFLRELDRSCAHHLTVKRLSFKPKREDNGAVLLASCGADNLVRIYRISVI